MSEIDNKPTHSGSARTADTELRQGAISWIQVLAQSVAHIGPTAGVAVLVSFVFAQAGYGAWLSWALGVIAMLAVAYCVALLTRRFRTTGSLYELVTRSIGPSPGFITGWAQFFGYLCGIVPLVIGFALFAGVFLTLFGLPGASPGIQLIFYFVAIVLPGRPLPLYEIRLVYQTGRSVQTGEPGEILVRGPGFMQGYWRDPEATRAVLQDDGWFHTGDLARMDEKGRYYFLGRSKDVIKRSGENISAAEVEEVLSLHEAVRMAACVPVKDEIRGEEVKAYVVLHAGIRSVTPQELADFCAQRLAYFKVPRYWELRNDLPRTPSEKLAKWALVQEKPDLTLGSYDLVEGVWR